MTEERLRVVRRPLRLVTVGYLLALGLIAFWPSPVTRPFEAGLTWLENWLPGSFAVLEFSANVALFVPAGMLLCLRLPRGWWWVVPLLALVTSTAIELGQAVLLPERVASDGDIIANFTGGTLGLAIVALRSGQRGGSPSARQQELG